MFEEQEAKIAAWRAANGRKAPTEDEVFSLPNTFVPEDYDDHRVEDEPPKREQIETKEILERLSSGTPVSSTGPITDEEIDFVKRQVELAGMGYNSYVNTLKAYGPRDGRDVVFPQLGESPSDSKFMVAEQSDAQKKALAILRKEDPSVPDTFTKGLVRRDLSSLPETPKGGYVDTPVVDLPETKPMPMSSEASVPPKASSVAPIPKPEPVVTKGGNRVKIVLDGGRLRAQKVGDPDHFVAFPNNLRDRPGSVYEVETLTWNGKNYRAGGKIIKISESGIKKFVTELHETIDRSLEEELNEDYDAQKDVRPSRGSRVLVEVDGEVKSGRVTDSVTSGGTLDLIREVYEVTLDDGDLVDVYRENVMVRKDRLN